MKDPKSVSMEGEAQNLNFLKDRCAMSLFLSLSQCLCFSVSSRLVSHLGKKQIERVVCSSSWRALCHANNDNWEFRMKLARCLANQFHNSYPLESMLDG